MKEKKDITDRIKLSLKTLAKKISEEDESLGFEGLYSYSKTLYELSIVFRYLNQLGESSQSLWEQHEKTLDDLIHSLQRKTDQKADDLPIESHQEAKPAPVIQTTDSTIINTPSKIVDENLFEHVSETPIFVEKNSKYTQERRNTAFKKNLNDQFSKGLQIDLNNRIAFIKHLFEGDEKQYQRIVNQITAMTEWEEIQYFLTNVVKPEYNNWINKTEFEERFLKVLENNFNK